MIDPQKRIISVTTSLAAVLALIIVLAFPVGYFVSEYRSLTDVLEARAETRAIYASQIIFANPDLWQFETIRLEHFLSHKTGSGEPEEQRIIDLKGQVVAQTTGHLPRPVHTVSYPLYESGRVVGYLEISRSLRPLLNYSLFLGALSLLLGAAVYATLKFYPLRALSQTLTLLNQERQRFRVIFQSSLMAVALLDRDCNILDANPTFSDFTLMSPEELRGRNFLDLVSFEPGEELRTLFRELLEEQRESFHLEMVYQRRDNAFKWGDLSVFALQTALGEKISCFVMFNDITARKQAEEALQEEAIRRRILVEQSQDGIVVLDQTGKVYEANRKYAEMLGYSAEEVRQLYVWDWDAQWTQEELLKKLRLADAAGEHFETRHRRKDGTFVDVEISTNGAVLAGQKLVFCVCRDITQRKRAQEALRLSETKFRELFENMSSAVAIYRREADGKDFVFLEVNRALERIEQVERADLLGRKVDEIFPGVKNFGLLDVLQRVCRTGIPEAFPVTWYHDQRISGWRENYVYRLPTGDVVAVYNDVTERKRAEEALSQHHRELQETARQLEQSRNMLQLIIESIPVRVFWKDTNLRYLGCNTLFAHDAGLSRPEQLLGQDDFAMGWREQAERYRADDRTVMESRRPKINIIEPQTTPTGGQIWLSTSKVPLQMPNGEVFGVLGVYEDITERKQAEEEIIHQREELRGLSIRLAEVEETERKHLARELHDQVCQNLANIAITLEILKIRIKQESPEELLPRLSSASALVEETGDVARDLMEGLRPTILDYHGLLGAVRWYARGVAQRTGITVEIQGEEAKPRLAKPVELALFRIAQEALNNVTKHAQASRVVLTEEVDQDTVRLVIADDGIGFDSEQLNLPEGGHRWGLMIMRERAMAAGGQCRIESQPGKGTRVVVEVRR